MAKSRQEKVAWLMAWDIKSIREDLAEKKFGYISEILTGDPAGWTGYGELSDADIDTLYQEAVDEERLDCPVVESIAKALGAK